MEKKITSPLPGRKRDGFADCNADTGKRRDGEGDYYGRETT